MSIASVSIAPARSLSLGHRALAYAELCKPRIATMVLVAVAASASIAAWGRADMVAVGHAMLGTLFVAASACATNQVWEKRLDRLMPRTAKRPLPEGRLGSLEAIVFASVALFAGVAWLLAFVGILPAALALATWILYVFVYTPLKTRTSLNTFVGAIPGALPVLIGWTAVSGPLDTRAAAIFLILFLWQFPHFMAIAWIYREQYGAAGFRMLPSVDRSGTWAGIQAIFTAAILLPVSLVPVLGSVGIGAELYAILAVVLGMCYLTCAILFARERSDLSARRLLRMSLVYLPLLLSLLVFLPGR